MAAQVIWFRQIRCRRSGAAFRAARPPVGRSKGSVDEWSETSSMVSPELIFSPTSPTNGFGSKLRNHFEVYFVREPGGGAIDITLDGATALDKPLTLNAHGTATEYVSCDSPADAIHRLE